MEGSAIRQAMDGQRDGNTQAMNFLRQYQQSQGQGGAQGAAPATPAPAAGATAGQAPSIGGSAGPISTASQNAFIQSALPHAQQIAAQTGVDPRLIVAQAALESNFGKSAPGGNYFGIKATGGQPSTGPLATKEAVNGALTPSLATFAAYGSPEASFAGYGKLMSGARYAGVRNGATLDDQLTALGKSGYATDPNYAAKVGAIARGISLPATPQGSTTASAAPTPNAPPTSDGTLRGDLMAAAAQHGGLDPDAPAPNATPTGMAGLPPGVTPADFDKSAAPSLGTSLPDNSDGMGEDGAGPAALGPGMLSPQPMAQQGGSDLRNDITAAMQPAPALTPAAMGPDTDPGPGTNAFDYAMSPTGTRDQYAPAAETGGLGAAPVTPDASMLSGAPDAGTGAGAISPTQPPLPPPGDQSQPSAPPSAMLATLLANGSPGASAPSGSAPSGALPIMARQSSNPPAALQQDFAGLAQAPAASPTAPAPGSGAALPQTGPTPPAGAQTLAAAGSSPDAPAPNAAPAGPAPVSPQMLAALSGSQQQPMGLVGNSAAADPNSPQNFARADAMRAQGGGGPTPGGFMAGIMGAGTPARGQGAPGSGLLGGGGPWLGQTAQPPSPVPDSTPASAPQSGGPAPAGAPPAGGAPPQGAGQAAAGASQPSASGGGGTPGTQGGQPDLFTQGMAVMNNSYASPELKSMVAQRLFPQMSVQKMDDGTLLGFNPQTGRTQVLYQGAKPVDLAPGHQLHSPVTGAAIGGVQDTPDKFSEGADGSILDKSKGTTTVDPNHFTTTEIDAGNGVKVPVRIGRNPDGSPNVQVMVPGANGSPAQGGAAPAPSQAGPISFNGPAGVAPPASAGAAPGSPPSPAQAGGQSPLGPQVQSLVDHAGAQQIQQAGAKAAAEANAKNDVDEVAASRTKLDQLRQSGQDIAQANAALAAYQGKMPTGPFGQNALWARGVANSVGLGDPNQLSNLETFSKVATKVASQQIKEFTSKGTNLDLETELKNNPGLSVSDQTNRILMDHLGRANAVQQQYEQAKQGFYDQNGSLKGFQPHWEQSISGANAIPLSRFPVATKTINGQTFQRYLSTDPSGYSWHPAGEVQ